ncbi:MAG: tyrosine-type recombinase/integrase [Alphaproteobacteria bacterium]|nr:tyrosine-type recombinase/integrase [Alphaproteobacteria bacterium]
MQVQRATKPGYYGDGGGLYLQIARGGSKNWVFRYRVDGKLREYGLGSLDTYTLAEAREKARLCRQMRQEGTDPIESRKAERLAAKITAARGMTFRQCAEAYIAARRASWKNQTHAAQWPATLESYVYPVFGDLPVAVVDVGLVTKVLSPIWTVKPETASRVRGRIEAVLDWAKVNGHRQGENPARWKGHLEHILAPPTKAKEAKRRESGRGEHHAALPYAELPAFMTALRQQDGVTARALEFTILTAARTGEVIGAGWGEINLTERLWVIRAERMKAGKEHRVPLSDAAVAILEKMAAIRAGEYVFLGQRADRPLSQMAMLVLLRRMGRSDLTVHGFRSAFSDWCAERTAFPAEVREMALAHAVGDKVEAAYRRGDLFQKRRNVVEAWARFCSEPVRVGNGKVVALGRHEHSA